MYIPISVLIIIGILWVLDGRRQDKERERKLEAEERARHRNDPDYMDL